MPLSVICAGFPRTGTVSLKTALEVLDIAPCYHMSEVIAKPDHWPLWMDALEGNKPNWEAIFKGYSAAADAPACHFYKELAEHYPSAKVILSTRDAERWYQSTQSTILLPALGPRFNSGPPGLNALMHKMGWHPDDPPAHDRAAMIGRFNAHNDAVKRTIAPARLLVFEASQGWAPLCRFLGKTVPDAPFPNINSTEEFEKMIGAISGFDPEGINQSLKEQASRQT